jgi:telomerase protein component 1
VFLSSTFRDFQGERDVLTRFVFPELRRRARTLRLHLCEIDLRWGVTEAQVRSGLALATCLDQVQQSHLFLGLLGGRYGSTVDAYDELALARHPWLKWVSAERSY